MSPCWTNKLKIKILVSISFLNLHFPYPSLIIELLQTTTNQMHTEYWQEAAREAWHQRSPSGTDRRAGAQ